MILICVLASVFVTLTLAEEPHWTRWPRATPLPTTPLTTKSYLWELVWAAKVEPGEYTTMVFQYFNDQLEPGNYPRHKYDRCYEDFMRCTLAYTLPQTVCAFKWLKSEGYIERVTQRGIMRPVSYCDMYHENCLAGHRAWRVLNYGWCQMKDYPNLSVPPLQKYSESDKSWYKIREREDYLYESMYAPSEFNSWIKL